MINVIIPAYNCAKTLERTLCSLVAQTDKDFEVILIDDCSQEDIKSIVDEYSPKMNIRYIRNEKNLGVGMTRQVGIDNASQRYITFLDSDDMFLPWAVETFNNVIKQNHEVEYLHTYFYKQVLQDDEAVLILQKDGFTWCHGKLYDVQALKKNGIKNSPQIKWADDSYFNSMCSELLKMAVSSVPTMLFSFNKDSVMRKDDAYRDKHKDEDFVNAMLLSAEFVKSKKGYVSHLQNTINNIRKLKIDDKQLLARIEKLERMYENGTE